MAISRPLRIEGQKTRRVLLGRCFDRRHRLRRECFPSSLVLCDRESSVPASPNDAGALIGGDVALDVAAIVSTLDRLSPANEVFLYYINIHDNLIDALRHFVLVESCRELLSHFRLFSDYPADEGGSSMLGLICPETWVLCLCTRDFCDIHCEFAGPEAHVAELAGPA